MDASQSRLLQNQTFTNCAGALRNQGVLLRPGLAEESGVGEGHHEACPGGFWGGQRGGVSRERQSGIIRSDWCTSGRRDAIVSAGES